MLHIKTRTQLNSVWKEFCLEKPTGQQLPEMFHSFHVNSEVIVFSYSGKTVSSYYISWRSILILWPYLQLVSKVNAFLTILSGKDCVIFPFVQRMLHVLLSSEPSTSSPGKHFVLLRITEFLIIQFPTASWYFLLSPDILLSTLRLYNAFSARVKLLRTNRTRQPG